MLDGESIPCRTPAGRVARLLRLWMMAALAWMVPAFGAGAEELVWELETWEVPFDYSSPSRPVRYEPLERATKKWRICASYPHLKDSYWLSVNYGMVIEAERLGVALQVVEAGGYPNLARQSTQIRDCTAGETDILVVGTVSFEGLTPTVLEIAERMPVTAVVNDIADPGISAKTGVSWTIMGSSIGEYLARQHPKGSAPVKIAWFPGRRGRAGCRSSKPVFAEHCKRVQRRSSSPGMGTPVERFSSYCSKRRSRKDLMWTISSAAR